METLRDSTEVVISFVRLADFIRVLKANQASYRLALDLAGQSPDANTYPEYARAVAEHGGREQILASIEAFMNSAPTFVVGAEGIIAPMSEPADQDVLPTPQGD